MESSSFVDYVMCLSVCDDFVFPGFPYFYVPGFGKEHMDSVYRQLPAVKEIRLQPLGILLPVNSLHKTRLVGMSSRTPDAVI